MKMSGVLSGPGKEKGLGILSLHGLRKVEDIGVKVTREVIGTPNTIHYPRF